MFSLTGDKLHHFFFIQNNQRAHFGFDFLKSHTLSAIKQETKSFGDRKAATSVDIHVFPVKWEGGQPPSCTQ